MRSYVYNKEQHLLINIEETQFIYSFVSKKRGKDLQRFNNRGEEVLIGIVENVFLRSFDEG